MLQTAELEEKFGRQGYVYTRVRRTAKVALYGVGEPGQYPYGFEVGIVQKLATRGMPEWMQKKYVGYDFVEQGFKDKDFGQTAWYFNNEQEALTKFEELTS